jgi:hypothetical protein
VVEIALGVIVFLLVVVAIALLDIVYSLHKFEDVLPAARKWLDEVERKERMGR